MSLANRATFGTLLRDLRRVALSRYGRRVEMPEAWLRQTWRAQLEAADVIEASTVLYVVTGDHDLGNVEMAYLPPNGYELSYEVLRRVGEERLHEGNGLHRLAVFERVRDAPLGGLAAMFRHELRHAEQFHVYGPGLFELNGHLRAALGVGTRAAECERYVAMPLEYDANRVAAAYAREQHVDCLEEMAADDRFAPYAHNDYDDRADDLLEATLAAVNEHVDPDSEWNGEPVSVDIAAQYDHARTHVQRDREFDRYNPTRGDGPGVVFI